jgi:dienelactone hydrolase
MERRMTPRSRIEAGDARARLAELARAYNDGTLGAPSPFFREPSPPQMQLAPAGDGPVGTQVVDLSWRSDFVPFLPAARDAYLAATENLTAHARWWTSDRGRPTIVVIHGWGGGNFWLEERTFTVPYWLKHGFDVVAFQLPFHGNRAAPAASRSMAARMLPSWPSPNPMRTNEGFGHAIYDLRALAGFLRARGASAVGAMGMSLGGYTTALWASLDELAFAVAMIPAVSWASLMWRHGEDSPARRRAANAGITEDLLADAFRVHAPLGRAPRVAHGMRFVIAGQGDRITPPEQAEALAAHWDVPVRWFEGGHLAQVGRAEAMRDVRRALGAAGLAGRTFRTS